MTDGPDDREQQAIREPGSLHGFPVRKLPEATRAYRAITKGNGPWYFTSSGRGRFDLPEPDGTCYVAGDMAAAIRERGGPTLFHAGVMTAAFVAEMELASLFLRADTVVALTGHREAVNFGCNPEIGTAGYDLTQQWAKAFWDAGLDGIDYRPRFSSDSESSSIALFGESGDAEWPVDAIFDGMQAVLAADLGHLLPTIPQSKDMQTVIPPDELLMIVDEDMEVFPPINLE